MEKELLSIPTPHSFSVLFGFIQKDPHHVWVKSEIASESVGRTGKEKTNKKQRRRTWEEERRGIESKGGITQKIIEREKGDFFKFSNLIVTLPQI